ncbi:MAG: tetratricopeptide repeat protein, partial [Flavobacteriaceae bacterium]
MIAFRLLLLLLLFWPFIPISGQQNQEIETLILSYNELPASIEKVRLADSLFILLRKNDLPKAVYYLRAGLQTSRTIGFKEGEAQAVFNLGKYHGKIRELDSIRFYFAKALDLYEVLEDSDLQFDVLHRWARLENLEGQFQKALELSEKSIALANEQGNGLMLGDALQRRATIYLDKGEYKLAIEELVKASRILDTIQPPQMVKKAIVDVGIGRTELLLNNYNNAIEKLQ